VGNHQRGLVQTTFKDITGMAWNINNTQIYFSSHEVYAVEASSGTLYPPLTAPTGYGPDSDPVYRPDSTSLYYLKTERDDQTTVKGGILAQVDTSQFSTFPLQELRGTMFFAQQIHFSRDGRFLVAAGVQDAFVQNMDVGSAALVVKNAKFPPQAVFSPDAETVAYVDSGAGANLIQQIWTVNRRGTDRKQLTNHSEGTITDMNWAVQ
jgi:Tol biopolymer transport system component